MSEVQVRPEGGLKIIDRLNSGTVHFFMMRRTSRSTHFPYGPLFRSWPRLRMLLATWAVAQLVVVLAI